MLRLRVEEKTKQTNKTPLSCWKAEIWPVEYRNQGRREQERSKRPAGRRRIQGGEVCGGSSM